MNRRRRPLAAFSVIAMFALTSACGSTAPAGTSAGGGGNKTAANAQKAVLFAECMRSNGVSEFPDLGASGKLTIDGITNGSSLGVNDFPDPANGEPLVDTNRIPSAATNNGMSILHAAMQKCGDVAAAAGVQR